ncbi:hypothetical protein ACFL1A_02840 [Patescibacteria group bacterium]
MNVRTIKFGLFSVIICAAILLLAMTLLGTDFPIVFSSSQGASVTELDVLNADLAEMEATVVFYDANGAVFARHSEDDPQMSTSIQINVGGLEIISHCGERGRWGSIKAGRTVFRLFEHLAPCYNYRDHQANWEEILEYLNSGELEKAIAEKLTGVVRT